MEQQLPVAVRVPQHAVYRHFINETVVLNLRTGKYHGLNTTAGRMLTTLDEVGDIAEAAARLAVEYGQPEETVREDLDELCRDLLERDVLESDPARETPA